MRLLALGLTLALLGACSSVTKEPSDAQINREAEKAYAEVKAKSSLSQNAQWKTMLDRVAARIAASSDEKTFKWEWILIESDEVNAWCMPGGKMAVYTGIMPVLENEAALAAVLGHEVAHATERHGKQRYARAIRGNLAGLVIGAGAVVGGQLLCKSETCRTLTGLGGAAAGLAVAFFDRKYSRGDETEADKVGQIYMARAGYPPEEAIKLWERMGAAAIGKEPPEFMSTHPSNETRRSDLRKWLPESQAIYEKNAQKHGTGERI